MPTWPRSFGITLPDVRRPARIYVRLRTNLLRNPWCSHSPIFGDVQAVAICNRSDRILSLTTCEAGGGDGAPPGGPAAWFKAGRRAPVAELDRRAQHRRG